MTTWLKPRPANQKVQGPDHEHHVLHPAAVEGHPAGGAGGDGRAAADGARRPGSASRKAPAGWGRATRRPAPARSEGPRTRPPASLNKHISKCQFNEK